MATSWLESLAWLSEFLTSSRPRMDSYCCSLSDTSLPKSPFSINLLYFYVPPQSSSVVKACLLLFLCRQWNRHLHWLPAVGPRLRAQCRTGVHLTWLSHWILLPSDFSWPGQYASQCEFSVFRLSSVSNHFCYELKKCWHYRQRRPYLLNYTVIVLLPWCQNDYLLTT